MTSRFWGANGNGLRYPLVPDIVFVFTSPAQLFPASGAWYDPSDFTTLFQDIAGTTPVTAAGQSVGKMLDKSGNGHHAVAPSSLARPLIQQDGGGQWSLSFDGTSQFMSSTAWTSIPQPIDRVSALKQATWSANRYMLDGGGVDEMILRQNGVTPQLAIYAGAAAGTNGAATLGTPAFVAERYNGASSSLTVGSTVVSGDAGANGNTGISIGGRGGDSAPFCPFNLYGLVIRGGTLTPQQLNGLHTWLSGKSGAA